MKHPQASLLSPFLLCWTLSPILPPLLGAQETGTRRYALSGSPGSAELSSEAGLHHTSLFTGSLNASLPIWIPTARQFPTPNIDLVYDSAAANSWVGLGWDIQLDTIERWTRDGPPSDPSLTV
jgi:hypothetical protein